MVLALTSKTLTQGQMYDAASNVLAQRLSQLSGVGNVNIGGSALPAVRVELNPHALSNYGIGLRGRARGASSANANSPKGTIDDRRSSLSDLHQRSGQRRRRLCAAGDRLSQRRVRAPDRRGHRRADFVQDNRNLGMSDGQPSVLVILYRQPERQHHRDRRRREGRVAASGSGHAGRYRTSPSRSIASTTIRASLHDTELTLVLAVMLVIRRGLLFLRKLSATIIPERRGADLDLSARSG